MNLNNFKLERFSENLIIFFFFISLLIIGFLSIGDYGVSRDEIAYKRDSLLQHEFIKNFLSDNYNNIGEIYGELHSKSTKLPSFFIFSFFSK